MKSQALRSDLLMLLTAMIWGSVFIAQMQGMEHIGPFLYTGLRFAMATLALLPLVLLMERRQKRKKTTHSNRGLLFGGLAMGVALTVGMNLQQVGLLFTTVTNAGFITGLYVIMVPLIGLLIGQRTGSGTWIGATLAVAGMFLLSVGDSFNVAKGDWLMLIGAVVWGAHVLLVGFFANRYDALVLSLLQFAVCAVISLLLALALEPINLDAIWAAGPALLYGGLIGVAIGFTLQVIAQQHAIASHAAVIFSLEAVFAAFFGAWLLNESLALKGYIGCGLMFAGMLIAQLWRTKPKLIVEAVH